MESAAQRLKFSANRSSARRTILLLSHNSESGNKRFPRFRAYNCCSGGDFTQPRTNLFLATRRKLRYFLVPRSRDEFNKITKRLFHIISQYKEHLTMAFTVYIQISYLVLGNTAFANALRIRLPSALSR